MQQRNPPTDKIINQRFGNNGNPENQQYTNQASTYNADKYFVPQQPQTNQYPQSNQNQQSSFANQQQGQQQTQQNQYPQTFQNQQSSFAVQQPQQISQQPQPNQYPSSFQNQQSSFANQNQVIQFKEDSATIYRPSTSFNRTSILSSEESTQRTGNRYKKINWVLFLLKAMIQEKENLFVLWDKLNNLPESGINLLPGLLSYHSHVKINHGICSEDG